jgi:hypothetical protein
LPKPSVAPAVDPSDAVLFSTFLGTLEDGAFDHDLTAALHELVVRMRASHIRSGGRPVGKISIAVELTMIDGMVQTAQAFKIDPQPARPLGRFYPTPTGSLTQIPPQIQEGLELSGHKGPKHS